MRNLITHIILLQIVLNKTEGTQVTTEIQGEHGVCVDTMLTL